VLLQKSRKEDEEKKKKDEDDRRKVGALCSVFHLPFLLFSTCGHTTVAANLSRCAGYQSCKDFIA
jgi:hypothetical protein